jgi:hypothetical protein
MPGELPLVSRVQKTGVNLVPGQQDGSDDATQERTLEGVGSTTGEGFAATPHACPAGMVRILLLS